MRRVVAFLMMGVLFSGLLSGCASVSLRREGPPPVSYDASFWHHNLFWSLWEVGGPVDLQAVCPDRAIEAVRVRQNFAQGAVRVLTASFWDPWEVKVKCSGLTETRAESKRGSHSL